MPRLTKAEQEARAALDESKAAGSVPYDRSLACRRCGVAVVFDEPQEGADTVVCEGCGTTNLIPEEVLVDAAD